MDLTDFADTLARGASVAVALLLMRLVAPAARAPHPARPTARWALALLAGLTVQMVAGHPLPETLLPRAWLAPAVGIAVGNAVLFAGLGWALLDPTPPRSRTVAAAWLAALALGTGNLWLGCAHRSEPWAVAAQALQRALPAVAAAVVLLAALRGWRGDLVEPRRRLRLWIAGAGAAYSLWQLALRLGQPGGRLVGPWALLDSLALLAVLVPVLHLSLAPQARLNWLLPTSPEPAPPAAARSGATPTPLAAPSPSDSATTGPDADDLLIAHRLQAALDAGVHRQGELTVASLAAQLRCPEYRLRRVIREQRGHGHFNQFLHQHRIADAQAALADPARQDEPVLAIALAVGYQSIGPFNRAFKALTGDTPSAWRRRNTSSPATGSTRPPADS